MHWLHSFSTTLYTASSAGANVSSRSRSHGVFAVDEASEMSTCSMCSVVVHDSQAAARCPLSTAEHRRESTSKRRIHEAVRDRVTAGRRKSEQVDEVHRSGRDVLDCTVVVEDEPRLKDVRRRPADEKLGHHHEQHLPEQRDQLYCIF